MGQAATLWINQRKHAVPDWIIMPPSMATEGGWAFILLMLGLLPWRPSEQGDGQAKDATGRFATREQARRPSAANDADARE